MTPAELDRLKELLEEATPGPWAYELTGEKDNSWGIGSLVDENDEPIAGLAVQPFNEETGEYGERPIVVDGICEASDHIPNAILITSLVNAAPSLLALAELGLKAKAFLEDVSDESVCSICSRLTGFGDEDKGEPPVNLAQCPSPGGLECRAVAQAVAPLRRENEVLRSNSDHLSSENASLSRQVESMAMRIESLAEELAKPEDVRLREVLDALEGRAVIFDGLGARVGHLLDEMDEWIGRAGEAERAVEAAQRRLACVADDMTEHAYQELTMTTTRTDDALPSPSRDEEGGEVAELLAYLEEHRIEADRTGRRQAYRGALDIEFPKLSAFIREAAGVREQLDLVQREFVQLSDSFVAEQNARAAAEKRLAEAEARIVKLRAAVSGFGLGGVTRSERARAVLEEDDAMAKDSTNGG